jgi:antitoxin (DNA-binding transcriptional repressor) of toxin-antitoxin stability system
MGRGTSADGRPPVGDTPRQGARARDHVGGGAADGMMMLWEPLERPRRRVLEKRIGGRIASRGLRARRLFGHHLTRSVDQVRILDVRTIGISEFKAKCIALLKESQRSGEALIVTLHGQPLVRVEPLPSGARPRRLGALRGSMTIHGDLVDSGFADDWEMEEG